MTQTPAERAVAIAKPIRVLATLFPTLKPTIAPQECA